MDYQDAIDYIREYLTTLYANPNIYEDGTYNIVQALEEFAIPALEKEIPRKVVLMPCRAEYGRRYYGCPNCREYVKYEHSLDKQDYYPGRCTECGQELDWD